MKATGSQAQRQRSAHRTYWHCWFLLLAVTASAQAGELRHVTDPIPNQYIVVLHDQAARGPGEALRASPRVAEVALEMALSHAGRVEHVYEHALKGFSIDLTPQKAEALANDPRVMFVEEDGAVSILNTQYNPTWGLDRIDQRDLPLSQTYGYGTTAPTVNVYILDTGIRATHVEFGGRVSAGYSSINDGRGTNDCHGHGTHVAGTVGGSTYGVAKGVRLYPVRVLDCGGWGTLSGVIAGIDWVTRNHTRPAVANMSLGGGASDSLDSAVNGSISAGVFYAVSAGNSMENACNYSPARVAAAMTAGATTMFDERAFYSNTGPCVDIFAPGDLVTSAHSDSDTATATWSGTSMASPHTAGVAALFLADNPTAAPAVVKARMLESSTQGRLLDVGPGSPNRLAFSIFEVDLTAPGGLTPGGPIPDGSVTVTTSPILLRWDTVSGAEAYEVNLNYWDWTTSMWIYDRFVVTAANSVTYVPPVNLTHYAWNVRAARGERRSVYSPWAYFYFSLAAGDCSYSVSPTSASFTSAGGSGAVAVTTRAGCPWTAQSNRKWIAITSASAGDGSAIVTYSVAAHRANKARTGSLTIAGKTVTVTQAGR